MYNYNNYIGSDYLRNTTPNNMMNNQPNIYSPSEGFDKGNMFSDLYSQYKNYQPAKLQATNEQTALFLELSRNAFAAHEMNLYLDLHPEDRTMLSLFNDYKDRENKLMKEYETKYGPLTVSSDNMNNSFSWVYSNWPWEGEKK